MEVVQSEVVMAEQEEPWGLGVGAITTSEFLKPHESNFKAMRGAPVRVAEYEICFTLVIKMVLNASFNDVGQSAQACFTVNYQ